MDRLNILREQYGHLPAQGTREWLEHRSMSIGGSELAAFVGLSKYRSPSYVIDSKLQPPVPFSNRYTNWGKIFESVSRALMELQFDTTIYEFGSIPSRFVSGLSYSPDGIGVIGKNLVLFEMKSPSRRIPTEYIPEEYYIQVQHGLHTIPEVDYAIFVDALYYKCSYEDLYTNGYDTDYHDGLPSSDDPVAFGIIGIYRDCQVLTQDESQGDDLRIDELQYNTKPAETEVYDYMAYCDDSQSDDCSDSSVADSDVSDSDVSDSDVSDSDVANVVNGDVADSDVDDYYTVYDMAEAEIDSEFMLPKYDIIDIGKYPKYKFYDIMNDITSQVDDPLHLCQFLPHYDVPLDVQIDEFLTFCSASEKKAIGIIPWKLAILRLSRVGRNEQYYERILATAKYNLAILHARRSHSASTSAPASASSSATPSAMS